MSEQAESKETTDMKYVSYRTTVASHRQLRLLALEYNTSMQGLIDEALSELFNKYGLPPFEVLR